MFNSCSLFLIVTPMMTRFWRLLGGDGITTTLAYERIAYKENALSTYSLVLSVQQCPTS